MIETITEAIELLGQLQFETGGPLLSHIVTLKRELLIERRRRIEILREAGLSDEQIGASRGGTFPPSGDRLKGCGRIAS
jgi:hypothetical protein